MRVHPRVAWLTLTAIAVGAVSALAGLVNYTTAKAHLEHGYGTFGSDPPAPSVAAVLVKYWWGWVVLLVIWISFVLLVRRAIRPTAAQPGAMLSDHRSAMKVIVGALVATLAAVAAVSLAGSFAGWF